MSQTKEYVENRVWVVDDGCWLWLGGIYRNGYGSAMLGAINRSKTSCKNGHEFDGQNTYFRPAGGRSCHRCHQEVKERMKTLPGFHEKQAARMRSRRAVTLSRSVAD
jgi:hypothetical protein